MVSEPGNVQIVAAWGLAEVDLFTSSIHKKVGKFFSDLFFPELGFLPSIYLSASQVDSEVSQERSLSQTL